MAILDGQTVTIWCVVFENTEANVERESPAPKELFLASTVSWNMNVLPPVNSHRYGNRCFRVVWYGMIPYTYIHDGCSILKAVGSQRVLSFTCYSCSMAGVQQHPEGASDAQESAGRG